MCALGTGVQTCALPICLFRFARDFAPAAIAAAETAGEVELVDRGIGVRLRLGYGAPRRGDVEHGPARRDDPAVAARRARMEDSPSSKAHRVGKECVSTCS